ncbi:hypothetical protein I6F07_29005 [Ensifer sp. IC4062]|nr:hypothetical protein [Ensifer sp. IC4062]MCA1444162.1 hypothetical protein [Ensifer sp. IC4062]
MFALDRIDGKILQIVQRQSSVVRRSIILSSRLPVSVDQGDSAAGVLAADVSVVSPLVSIAW